MQRLNQLLQEHHAPRDVQEQRRERRHRALSLGRYCRWTTYPSKIGHTPPKLAKDVLAIWRDVARQDGYHFSAYYNIGRDGEIANRHFGFKVKKQDEYEAAIVAALNETE